jgi:Leucine-rich repeat (LRR) protein
MGCELRNVVAANENFEINMMARDGTNHTEADVTWVQIRDSQFKDLPKGVFEKFENMEKIMILTSTGFKILNTTYFDKRITLVLMKTTDLEEIGEDAFVGLTNITILSLNYNKISKVHKNAFRDLVKVDKIEMVSNNIEFLDDDTFRNNVNLRLLLLYHNKIRVKI